MRAVHEIVQSDADNRVVIAFIQHGREETGFTYEVVCPWCAETILNEMPSPDPETFKNLCNMIREVTALHVPGCRAGGFHLRVYKTNVPLNTEEKPKVM